MIIYVKPGRNKKPVYIIADGQEPDIEESETEKNVKQLMDAFLTVFKGVMLFAGIMAVIGFIVAGMSLTL